MNPWVKLVGNKSRTPDRRVRLAVERLEDRATPATFTVTTFLDDNVAHVGFLSLRQAVEQANANGNPDEVDIIRFAPGLAGRIIRLDAGLGQLEVTESVFVNGLGASKLTISGERETRIFELFGNEEEAVRVTIRALTLTRGYATADEEDPGNGGAIETIFFDEDDSLTLIADRFIDNNADSLGGAVCTDGGNVIILDSLFHHNTADFDGGAVIIGGVDGNLLIDRCTFSFNRAFSGEGGGLWLDNDGIVARISRSTFYHNDAEIDGGGIGSCFTFTDLTIENSTISGNETRGGDGGGIGFTIGNLRLRNCTIAFNNAREGRGGGVFGGFGAFIDIHNTIIDGNRHQGGLLNDIAHAGESGAVFNVRFSLIRSYIVDGVDQINGINDHNILGFSANLFPLGAYGGPTLTHAINVLSKAFSRGSVALAAGLPTDQRGLPRVIRGFIDIGAYQSQTTMRRRNWGPGFYF